MTSVRRTARFVHHNSKLDLYNNPIGKPKVRHKKSKGKRARSTGSMSPEAQARAAENLLKRWRPNG
jgi:hypothetical protein